MSEERKTVSVTHRYRQSPETVFDAWLDPAIAGRFLFATPTGQMVRAEIDAKVGGAFRFTDRRDGEDIDHVGRYEALERPGRLVFTFAVPKYSAEESRVEIRIRPDGGGSELTLIHTGVLADYAERTVGGWTMILDTLGEVVG
jgi:uncharacterized protein YndB with AHSA1/START domain